MNTTNTGHELYTGYDPQDLIEMYDEARAMMLACLYAGDKGNAAKWKQIAIDCAVTLYALRGGHEL